MPLRKRRIEEPAPVEVPRENPWAADLGDERSRLLDASGNIAVRREHETEILSMRPVESKKRGRR